MTKKPRSNTNVHVDVNAQTPPTAADRAVIVADGIDVSIGKSKILHDITLDVQRGEWVGLVGPNGSGKTTLLRAMSGLLPSEGHLSCFGQPIGSWSRRDLARRMAFVRQSVTMQFAFRVEDFVLMGRTPHKQWLDPMSARDRGLVRDTLDRLNLAGYGRRYVTSLSGGELQRVILAQALVQETEVLLLDEPTAHLDVYHQYDFLEHVRRLVVDRGRTIVAVFHDLEQAARYAQRLIVLDSGRVVAAGTTRNVLDNDLIARVFHMEARLSLERDVPRITYLRPLPV
jgi:iron complex transport system ATP-binding protein